MQRHLHRFTETLITAMICLCLFPTAYAKHIKHHHKLYKSLTTQTASENGWFVSVGAGVARSHVSKSRINVPNGAAFPPPFNQDLYTVSNPASKTVLQAQAGYRWRLPNLLLPYASTYLQYRHYNSSNITGTVDQYSLPEFLNYNYRMTYSADLITLNGKLTLCDVKHLMPYVAGGIGVIFNRLSHYTETPTANVTPRISPNFSANTQTHFAGTLGVGFDLAVTHNIGVTLGYEHVFQSNLPRVNGQNTWAGTSLNFGNIKLDTVFLAISAKFPDTFQVS